ncbi:MAG: hypothetical protein O6949_08305 [Chloroflexi bacterium]|nr:hypothetical protein [Chloroflexota bacterium]
MTEYVREEFNRVEALQAKAQIRTELLLALRYFKLKRLAKWGAIG